MAGSTTYTKRRGELETYFDRTAVEAWAKLTSDAPVSGIRATVRAGRDRMRQTLLGWLPDDLSGRRVLDAGCGAGQLSIEAAWRGADVVGIDLSPTLLDLARDRYAGSLLPGHLEFRSGDMFDPALGTFDHIVAMDSLIHYPCTDIVRVLNGFAARAAHSVLFTFAPRTPALAAMHTVGKLFPHGDRSPAIEPVPANKLRRALSPLEENAGVRPSRDARVSSGFYISHAMELVRR